MLRKWSLLLQKRTMLLGMIISWDADHAVESMQSEGNEE